MHHAPADREPTLTVPYSLIAFVLMAVGALLAVADALDGPLRSGDLLAVALAAAAGAGAYLVWTRRETVGGVAALIGGVGLLLVDGSRTGAILVLIASVTILALHARRPDAPREREAATSAPNERDAAS